MTITEDLLKHLQDVAEILEKACDYGCSKEELLHAYNELCQFICMVRIEENM